MTPSDRKELITWLENRYKDTPMPVSKRMFKLALEAVREQTGNEPLTLEQLREMDREPVWIDEREEPEYSGWYIVYWDRGKYLVLQSITTHGFLMDEYGKTWLAYRRPPERSENDGTK